MEELKKINSKIAVKQIGRIVGGSCFMVLGRAPKLRLSSD